MNFSHLLASRTEFMSSSVIREILKQASRPGMISLAGGIPAPETFPMDILEEVFLKVIKRWGSSAFQYDLTEGFTPLREAAVPYLSRYSVEVSTKEILVSSGSQGLLDSLGKALISPGDLVAVESPTYLGAIQAFNPYGPRYVEIESDENGVVPKSLEKVLVKDSPKFVYMVPTFQNPTGRTIPLERRRAIADIIVTYNALLIEDDPYAALRYRGEDIPSIKSMAPDHVLYATTLSKVFAPGLRVGLFVPPSEELGTWLVKAKQGTDLHTSTLSQAMAAIYLESGYLEKRLPLICNFYHPRLKALLEAMDEYFPPEWNWSRPEGGMFLWAEGPERTNILELYKKALSRDVAFVPGEYFYANSENSRQAMRLNFTNADPDTLRHAVKTLASLIVN